MTKVYYGGLKKDKSRNSLMIALSPCFIHQACKIKITLVSALADSLAD